MNSPLEVCTVERAKRAESEAAAERLADYLDNLLAPLVGIVPYAERRDFREEAGMHVEGLIDEFLNEGTSLLSATETALGEFGEPWRIGEGYLEEWLRGGNKEQKPATLVRKANFAAFGAFGIASTLLVLLLEQVLLVPNQDSLVMLIGAVAVLAPLAAGAFTALMCPAYSERGVRNAILLLIVHTLIAGILLPTRSECGMLAAWQLLFWLPAGRITAGTVAVLVRESKRHRFLELAR